MEYQSKIRNSIDLDGDNLYINDYLVTTTAVINPARRKSPIEVYLQRCQQVRQRNLETSSIKKRTSKSPMGKDLEKQSRRTSSISTSTIMTNVSGVMHTPKTDKSPKKVVTPNTNNSKYVAKSPMRTSTNMGTSSILNTEEGGYYAISASKKMKKTAAGGGPQEIKSKVDRSVNNQENSNSVIKNTDKNSVLGSLEKANFSNPSVKKQIIEIIYSIKEDKERIQGDLEHLATELAKYKLAYKKLKKKLEDSKQENTKDEILAKLENTENTPYKSVRDDSSKLKLEMNTVETEPTVPTVLSSQPNILESVTNINISAEKLLLRQRQSGVIPPPDTTEKEKTGACGPRYQLFQADELEVRKILSELKLNTSLLDRNDFENSSDIKENDSSIDTSDINTILKKIVVFLAGKLEKEQLARLTTEEQSSRMLSQEEKTIKQLEERIKYLENRVRDRSVNNQSTEKKSQISRHVDSVS